MAFVKWDEQFAVGVQVLDAQHVQLFDIINELHEAIKSEQSQEITGAELRKLAEYTVNHFSTEEALMTQIDYPGLDDHIAAHRTLIAQVGEFFVSFERGEASINFDLLIFLQKWITNHILEADKEYGPWMNELGIE